MSTVMSAIRAVIDRQRDRNAYQLASDADCGTPDALDSAGARVLTYVRDGVIEMIEYHADEWAVLEPGEVIDALDSIDDDGSVHEIADGAPNIYTHRLWSEFVDLQAYNEDISGHGDIDCDDLSRVAGVAVYVIARRLADDLVSEYRAELEEIDGGEEQ